MILFLATACGKKGDLTLRAFEKPAAAGNISALHRDNEINIFWQYPAHEMQRIKGCQVMRSDDGGIIFKELAFLNPDKLLYVDKNFAVGREYYYKIRCLSVRNIYSDDSAVIKVIPLPLPQKPEDISYKVENDSIKIHWRQAADLKYNIYKSFQKGDYSISPLNNEPLSENYFNDKIETGKTVYYTVRALLGTEIRDEGPPSEELEVNPASFVPSRPSGLKHIPVEKASYLLWKENPEAWVKGYRVYRKRLIDDNFVLIGEPAAPVFADAEPLASKTVYYITAVGPVKESLPSEMLEAAHR